VILGPHETVGRLPWWLGRMARGGCVLAPGDSSRRIQPIDVCDIAGFIVDGLQAQRAGVFNLTAPIGRDSFGGLLAACVETVGADVELIWVDDDVLVDAGCDSGPSCRCGGPRRAPGRSRRGERWPRG